MTPEKLAEMKRWVDTWKAAGPELEAIREEEVRKADTALAFKAFTRLRRSIVQRNPPQPTSGLVEQQRWFKILAEKQRRG